MKVLRWLGIGLGVLVLLALGLYAFGRVSDGPPVPYFSGAELTSGELVTGPEPDWSFVEDVQTVEFQLLEPPRSRVLWVVYHEGSIYVPCGFLSNTLWKKWPHEAMKDGRSVVRIEGKRYERQAVRVTDDASYRAVLGKVMAKYGGLGDPATADPAETWIFRLDPSLTG